MTTNYLVLGYGTIGWAIAGMLPDIDEDCSVTVADPNKVHANIVDDIFTNPEIVKDYDYVINTVPIYGQAKLAPVLICCLQGNTHYLDTNEDVNTNNIVKMIGSFQKDILFAPGCGLAPGLINIIGGYLNRKLPGSNIDLRVGALTRLVENRYNYTPTWSPKGIVNQYLNDFQVVDNGKAVTHPNIFGDTEGSIRARNRYRKEFIFDGIEYECFPTSGGIGTMVDLEDAGSITYRSIRLKGHVSSMWTLIHNNDRDAVIRELESYWDAGAEDFVLVTASATQAFDPRRKQTIILKTIGSGSDGNDGYLSAIQKTTAASVTAIIELHRRGSIPGGFLHQHNVDWHDFTSTQSYPMMEFE